MTADLTGQIRGHYSKLLFQAYTKLDIETAMATALVDELMEGFNNTYLVVGFDTKTNTCKKYRKGLTMPILTDEEADALDEMLTKTTPKTNPQVQGPFIKNRERVIVLDTFSTEYLKAKMMATNKTLAELINRMIRREMALAETAEA
ncbi:MAG: hypothetical protein LBD93_12005 [Treponema sp.]|jgi:hypothetical protein|nr:hypothetical protein [Treponema sp.]